MPVRFTGTPCLPFTNLSHLVLLIIRIRRHRESITSILSAQSLDSSRFIRLFIMSMLLLLIYLPVVSYLFYMNLSQEFSPYVWDVVHDPETWGDVLYLPAMGVFTFDQYIPGAMALFVFAFFGMGTEARRIYKSIAVACGLAHCFPQLLNDRRSS